MAEQSGKPTLDVNSNKLEIMAFIKEHKVIKLTENKKRKSLKVLREELEAGGYFVGVEGKTKRTVKRGQKLNKASVEKDKEAQESYQKVLKANPQGFNVSNKIVISGFKNKPLPPLPTITEQILGAKLPDDTSFLPENPRKETVVIGKKLLSEPDYYVADYIKAFNATMTGGYYAGGIDPRVEGALGAKLEREVPPALLKSLAKKYGVNKIPSREDLNLYFSTRYPFYKPRDSEDKIWKLQLFWVAFVIQRDPALPRYWNKIMREEFDNDYIKDPDRKTQGAVPKIGSKLAYRVILEQTFGDWAAYENLGRDALYMKNRYAEFKMRGATWGGDFQELAKFIDIPEYLGSGYELADDEAVDPFVPQEESEEEEEESPAQQQEQVVEDDDVEGGSEDEIEIGGQVFDQGFYKDIEEGTGDAEGRMIIPFTYQDIDYFRDVEYSDGGATRTTKVRRVYEEEDDKMTYVGDLHDDEMARKYAPFGEKVLIVWDSQERKSNHEAKV